MRRARDTIARTPPMLVAEFVPWYVGQVVLVGAVLLVSMIGWAVWEWSRTPEDR